MQREVWVASAVLGRAAEAAAGERGAAGAMRAAGGGAQRVGAERWCTRGSVYVRDQNRAKPIPGKNGDYRDGGDRDTAAVTAFNERMRCTEARHIGKAAGSLWKSGASVTCYSGIFWPWCLPLFSFWNSHYRRVTLMHSHVLLLGTKSALVAIYFFHAFFSSFAGTLG